MDNEKGKASSDPYTTKILIDVCAEQIVHKEHQGTSFIRPGWNKITKSFQKRSEKMYDRKQFKNRFDILRKDWKLWEKLMSGETGIGYDAATNRVAPNFKKFRHQGLMFASNLMKIFKDVVASGEYMCTPSASQPKPAFAPQPDTEEEEDVYRVGLDQQEGLRTVRMKISRKRGETSDAKKKKEVATSTKISDSLSVIATAFDKQATTLVENPQLVDKVLAHLATLEELNDDP
ncbi:L10-interacting MYB domain-containing protein-like [Neltuma alba]|uniref:L10-interacting MYB domain-containing protein-like n=1 Tax=Neltuma alba TaxID=207710 RepID=UPI0010A3E4F0|nr:L10-interacting MYB domain-containing protein-like [Prosopis alba]